MAQDVPIGKAQVSLAQLNERSREIFRQIVESYLSTGEPLGSRNLSRLIIDAAVARLGPQRDDRPGAARPDLFAAHLGRPAADRARPALLRRCADADRRHQRERPPRDRGAGRGRRPSVESVLDEASGLLSGLTRTAGVVLAAKSNVRLKHIEFVRLEPERALVVLVSDDGQVENRVVTLPVGLPSSALIEATNFLNARVRGKTLAEAKVELERP